MSGEQPTFRLGGAMPIPMSKKRVRSSTYFRIPSPKLGEPAECESPNELHNIVRHEGSPRVIALCPQPYRIEARVDGKKLVTLLDLWLRYDTDEEALEEVKPDGRLKRHDDGTRSPAKWPQVLRWAEAMNATVRFVTDKDLRPYETHIASWQRALPYIGPSRPAVDDQTMEAVRASVASQTATTLGSLVRELTQYPTEDVITAAVQLLHRGEIVGDLHERLFSMTTQLRPTDA